MKNNIFKLKIYLPSSSLQFWRHAEIQVQGTTSSYLGTSGFLVPRFPQDIKYLKLVPGFLQVIRGHVWVTHSQLQTHRRSPETTGHHFEKIAQVLLLT